MTFFVFVGCATAVNFSSIRKSNFAAGASTSTNQTTNELIKSQTDFLVNTITINSSFGIATAMAFGMAIMVLVYSLGHVSGGQFNPAVSLGLWLSGNLPLFQMIVNMCAQVLGAILAAGLIYGMTPDPTDSTLGSNAVAVGYLASQAFLGEVIMTALLVFVVHMTVCDANNSISPMAPLAIGFAVFLAHTVLIPVDGCSINPARSLGPAIVSGHFGNKFWVFIIGPFLGSFFGATAWLLVSKQWDRDNFFSGKVDHAAGGAPVATDSNGIESPQAKALNEEV